MKGALPREVLTRRKKPFQAPVGTPFVGENAPDYAREFLDPRRLKESGYFDPAKVAAIAKRLETPMTKRNLRRGLREFVDSCALTFVLTTQMLDGEARSGAIASAS
jgi:asparagine synthase (glutamine-hydrolysing)